MNGAFLELERGGVQISTLITSTVKVEPNYAMIKLRQSSSPRIKIRKKSIFSPKDASNQLIK